MVMDYFKLVSIFVFAFSTAECYYIMTTCILIKRTKVNVFCRTLFTQQCSVLVLKEVVHITKLYSRRLKSKHNYIYIADDGNG
jgi:hypothetical protein